EKYIFILFAHGRGIIDTKSLTTLRDYKSVLLSPDETGQRAMTHHEFNRAIVNGLSGEKFHLMLFFSCLTNMVEVGYELQDVTRYMIGSEDEIRMVNKPAGMFQIRGIKPEKLIGKLTSNLDAPALELGKVTIDSFISQYLADINVQNDDNTKITVKYQASLALVDCHMYDKLAKSIDILTKHLIEKIQNEISGKEVLISLHTAINESQKYPSFLNLEYLDLQDILENLSKYSEDVRIKELCQNSIDILENELIVYERHTDGSRSHGVSIFLPSFLVPENIYRSHMSMYRNSRFSRDTSWGELIDTYRAQMLEKYSEILIDEYEQAYVSSDTKKIGRLNQKLSWALRKDALIGKYISIKRYLKVLKKMDTAKRPKGFLRYLQDVLKIPGKHHQVSDDLLKTFEVQLRSRGELGN
ncbi:MAG: hypothetical protein HKP41_02470, partial [Desulfobacterales bacterium]|nr:hypothetical protein [Desulfobacterales bacterium]